MIMKMKNDRRQDCDRFIPYRSAMDFDYATGMITTSQYSSSNKGKENTSAYQKRLAEAMNMNRTRILEFKYKPCAPVQLFPPDFFSGSGSAYHKPLRRSIPQTSERTLDAIDLVNDDSLNLLDWGSRSLIAIGLGKTVYLWDATLRSTSELVTYDDDIRDVTSVGWAPDGRCLAVGLNNSQVDLWDSTTNHKLRTLTYCHTSRVGSLAWANNNLLTTGGMDGRIVVNDLRIRSHIVERYRGHEEEVCGLKWSASGAILASGGKDNLLHVWDSRRSGQWLHRLENHSASVRALAWCPFEDNLLASGGGERDGCIKLWNTQTGVCLNSIETGSEVCALLWSNKERELLSSHGYARNQLTLWNYPSMTKITELTGHTSRVLYMARSPDGCTVASAAGDKKLKFWNVFGDPQVAKPTRRANPEPFAHLNRIR